MVFFLDKFLMLTMLIHCYWFYSIPSRCGLNEWSSSLEQRAQVLVLVLHLNIHLLGSQIDRVTLLKYRRVVESPSPTPIKAKLSPRLQGEAVILFHEPLVAVERVKVAF